MVSDLSSVLRVRILVPLIMAGAVWLVLWSKMALGALRPGLPFILGGGALLLYFAARARQLADGAMATAAGMMRAAGLLGVLHGLLLVALFFLLHRIGLIVWIMPVAMCLTALYGFCLSRVMPGVLPAWGSPALMLFALCYPWLCRLGPISSSGPLGAGLILWGIVFSLLARLSFPSAVSDT